MDLSIKYSYTNISFNARIPKSEKIKMDSVLTGLLKNDEIDINGIINESGYTKNFVYGWFKGKFGLSPKEYFAQKQEQKLENEFIKLYNQGLSDKQLARYFSRSIKWAKSMIEKLELVPIKSVSDNVSDKKVFSLLNKGYTLNAISKESEYSASKIKKMIRDNYNENIIQYRKNKGIKLNHETKLKRKRSIISKYFSEGRGIKETAELTGVSKTSIFHLKDDCNMQTALDRAHELMDIFLPDMVKAGDSLLTMSRFFGISRSTVSRRIKTLCGENYSKLIKGQ